MTPTPVNSVVGASGAEDAQSADATTTVKTDIAKSPYENSSFDAVDRERSVHDLVQLVQLYESFAREVRARFIDGMIRSFSDAELRLCNGQVHKRYSRDAFNYLCFAANVNAGRERTNAIGRVYRYGFFITVKNFATDKFMVKNFDLWYDYCSREACAWNHYSAELLEDSLKQNQPLVGNLCHGCVTALLKLSRHGLCSDIAKRLKAPKGANDVRPTLSDITNDLHLSEDDEAETDASYSNDEFAELEDLAFPGNNGDEGRKRPAEVGPLDGNARSGRKRPRYDAPEGGGKAAATARMLQKN